VTSCEPHPSSPRRSRSSGLFDIGDGFLSYRTSVDDTPTLRLFAATSGWEGPFQHEQVIVAARGPEEARTLAEGAFAGVAQPVCRAKMRIADLGPVATGVVAGPLRAGESLAAAGEPVDLRCGVEPA
jgi:hypothetical protein